MKLIILGNGFDLHHGLKTSFFDFRNHLIESNIKANLQLVSKIDSLLSAQKIENTPKLLWNDYESGFAKIYEKQAEFVSKGLELNAISEEFAEKFYLYLQNEIDTNNKFVNPRIRKVFENADCVLTFNYTDTYTRYLSKNPSIEVFHIHGQLEQNNLPIIGYYYENVKPIGSDDYLKRYSGLGFHKPALAKKQNEIDFEKRLHSFTKPRITQFSEIISIGYSYGRSDNHVYKILDSLLLLQPNEVNVPYSKVSKIPIIEFGIFRYSEDDYLRIVSKIKSHFSKNHNRNSTILVHGSGTFTPQPKEIMTFKPLEY